MACHQSLVQITPHESRLSPLYISGHVFHGSRLPGLDEWEVRLKRREVRDTDVKSGMRAACPRGFATSPFLEVIPQLSQVSLEEITLDDAVGAENHARCCWRAVTGLVQGRVPTQFGQQDFSLSSAAATDAVVVVGALAIAIVE